MLLIILALFWVALLAPIVVRRLRDNGTEKSIQSFHTEHEVLSRQEYTVPPAHRLDQPDEQEVRNQYESRRPRLTVVHDDDTYGSLESRGSWKDWSEDYEFEASPGSLREVPRNRYAAAYSSVPKNQSLRSTYEAPTLKQRSMKARRRVVFTRLVLAAVLISIIGYFAGYSMLVDLAVASWLAVVGFVALALYSVSQGYLDESSLPLRLPQRRQLANVQPLYNGSSASYEDQYDDDSYDEFYEPEGDTGWRRESQPHRALG
jgi:small-conductance mechanosensitive channel